MSKIEERVMASVAVIYAVRKLASRTALKLYVLVLSLVGVVTLVSISNVTANFTNVAQNGVESVAAFLVAAVLGTTIMVQVALFLGTIAVFSLMVDAMRSFSSSSRTLTA
jgi:uncharacterized membrane protein